MTSDPTPPGPPDIEAINSQASVLMKQGIRRLADGDAAAAAEALVCFDHALELRRGLPIDQVPLLRYGLAACWVNRGDALMRLGDLSRIPVAVQAYDEGIALLRGLPLGDDPKYPRRLAITHQNRGLALHTQGIERAAAAVAAFHDAIAILDHDDAALIPDRQYLLAAVWLNLANARAVAATAESEPLARAAAQRAIGLVAALEDADADAAEVGLKARHVFCRTVASRLSRSGDVTPDDDVHDATDAVDEGLDLVRRWEQKGVERFRALASDLFRFGALVYERYQPQFLEEFVRENMDPGRSSAGYVATVEMRVAAEGALQRSRRMEG